MKRITIRIYRRYDMDLIYARAQMQDFNGFIKRLIVDFANGRPIKMTSVSSGASYDRAIIDALYSKTIDKDTGAAIQLYFDEKKPEEYKAYCFLNNARPRYRNSLIKHLCRNAFGFDVLSVYLLEDAGNLQSSALQREEDKKEEDKKEEEKEREEKSILSSSSSPSSSPVQELNQSSPEAEVQEKEKDNILSSSPASPKRNSSSSSSSSSLTQSLGQLDIAEGETSEEDDMLFEALMSMSHS